MGRSCPIFEVFSNLQEQHYSYRPGAQNLRQDSLELSENQFLKKIAKFGLPYIHTQKRSTSPQRNGAKLTPPESTKRTLGAKLLPRWGEVDRSDYLTVVQYRD